MKRLVIGRAGCLIRGMRIAAATLLCLSGPAWADSVYDPTDDSERFFPPFTLAVLATCDGPYTEGYVWARDYPRRHFLFYGDTSSGRTYVVSDVLFKSSMGDSCGPSGQVLED